jgi:hypothetical protein
MEKYLCTASGRGSAAKLHRADIIIGISDDMNELEIDILELFAQRLEKRGVSAQPCKSCRFADDAQLVKSTLPLIRHII